MMHITDFHDASTIAARTQVEDRLRAAKREAIYAEAKSDRRHAYIASIGHALVRIGERLQGVATRPATMEETVQW